MQRNMYEAKCATCNQPTTVPFKPTPGKPVYCRTCFGKRSTDRADKPLRENTRSNFEPKQAWARRR